jgi:sensor domain CHASE-containing protein
MKLRAKVIWMTASLFGLLAAAQFIVQQQVLLPTFAELERQAAKTDMDRVGNTITREIDLLSITARDYGNWLDTYEFMQDRNQDYIGTNLTEDSISTLRVNVMAFIDRDGHFIWATGRQLESSETINLDFVDAGGLPGNHPWSTAVSDGTATSGVLTTNQGALLAVLAPVLDGQGQGPHRGMVLLGRLLTDEELSRIGEQAQVKLSRAALPPAGPLAPLQPEVLREHDTFTEVFRLLRDTSGGPALMLRIEVPRTISASGARTVYSATMFLVGAGAIVLLLTVTFLNREVLSPLAKLTRHATVIGETDNLTSRLDLKRADELGDLATGFDRMVGRLAEARRQLVDQSFDAGIAENASGVLHNLGNAMTPVSVKIACLKQSLQAAPTGDIELALAELAQGTPDANRKADLDEFLRLSSSELARVVTGALQDVESDPAM